MKKRGILLTFIIIIIINIPHVLGVCGDHFCESGESVTCPDDCAGSCGDGYCADACPTPTTCVEETCGNTDTLPECNTDCGSCCPPPCTEGTYQCPGGQLQQCQMISGCLQWADTTCTSTSQCSSCDSYFGTPTYCNPSTNLCESKCPNGQVDPGETCSSCPQDVGACDGTIPCPAYGCEHNCVNFGPGCSNTLCYDGDFKVGDGCCDTANGESCSNSPADCGSCAEDCANNADDDGDGKIDCQDAADCPAPTTPCGTCKEYKCSSTTYDWYCGNSGTDVSCGTTTYCNDLDTTCRNYYEVTRYCNGAGTCGDPACDSYTDAPAGTTCDTIKECDGAGNCVVVDLCSGITCTTPPNTDCYEPAGTCNPSTGECEYTAKADGTDCALNKICSSGNCICDPSKTCPTPNEKQCVGGSLQLCSLIGDCKIWNTILTSCGQNAQCPVNHCVCNYDYGNCNNDWNDGCEINTDTDNSNCGSCGNSCLAGETCIAGICSVCTTNADCDDGNDCTVDICSAGTCSYTNFADNTLCDDGNLCTIIDVCSAGTCSGTLKNCNDNNECTTDSCTAGNCVNENKPDGTQTSYENVICLSGAYSCDENYYNTDNWWPTGCLYYCEYQGSEVCDADATDEDCDYEFNEGCSCVDGTTQSCGIDIGECSKGTQTCVGGVLGDCQNYIGPSEELCDGLDNNCDGFIDEIFPDEDGDGFISCFDCDDTNKDINENATEICNFIDDDCDGQKDEGNVCTCDKLKDLKVTGIAEIIYPADNANFIAGNIVSFLAEESERARAYLWEFGDGSTDPNEQSLNIYTAAGDYEVKLRVIDDYSCENIETITVHIASCQNNDDCDEGKTCENGICKQTEIIPQDITDETLIITIHSPTNQLYAQNIVPLSYTTSIPVQCSYSLNNGNFITIQPQTNSVTGKEGANTLIVKCEETTAQRQFTVQLETEPTTVFDDMKGKSPDESLFNFMEEKGEEIKLTPSQVEEVILEVMEIQGLKITKSREISGSKSLIMLSIKNLLPITLENTKIKVTIPKTISETAEEIQSPQDFTIIENDPVIEFIINAIGTEQDSIIMFEVNSIVDEEMLNQITAETEDDLASLIKKQQDTAKAAKITKEFEEFEKDGETYTKIKTKIKPKKGLKGMSLIEKIPKCLAQQIDYIEMDEKYRNQIKIINPDPLIMWHFEEITSEEYFEYEVKGVLSKDCKNQIRSLGIAEELGLDIESRSYFRIILPLLIIPLIGVLVIHFHRFHPKKEGKEEKKTAEKKLEKPRKPEKPHIEMKEEKDIGKFLDKEIKKAEKEFGKGLK